MFDERLLLALEEADLAIRERRPEAALAALDAVGDAGGPVRRCLWLAASALVLEQRGAPEEAMYLLEEARRMEVPLTVVIDLLVDRRRRAGIPMSAADRTFLLGESPEPDSVGDRLGTARAFATLPPERGRHVLPWAIRSAAVGPMDGYPLGALKTELVAWLGPEAAAVLVAGADGDGQRYRVRERPIVSLVDHAREHGYAFEALNHASQVTMLPPRFLGEPVGPAYTVPSRSVFSCQIADAIVTGKSNIVLADGVALLDHQLDERIRIADDLAVDAVVIVERDGRALVMEPMADPPVPWLAEAAWLGGVHSREFGHWAIELLPKLFALSLRAGFDRVPILVDRQMPEQHFESLRVFLGDDWPVVIVEPGTSVRVERLWVASMYVCMPTGAQLGFLYGPGTLAFDPGSLKRLTAQANRLSAHVAPAEGSPDIYLSRKPSQRRRLVNAPEIEELLASEGFAILDFAEIPFARQLALIRGARRILAADGSALGMLPFAAHGTRVGILGLPYPDNVEWPTTISRVLGFETYVLGGRVVDEYPGIRWFSDYEIEPARVEELLQTLGTPLAEGFGWRMREGSRG